MFEPDGDNAVYLTELGVGLLDDPYGIAIDQASGDVYVSDAGNARILRFESDGADPPAYTVDPSFTSPLPGTATGRIGDARAPLAVDPTGGDLLVADRADDLVQRYDSGGAFEGSFAGADAPSGPFAGLLDLATAPNGDILVVDSTGDIVLAGASSRVERFNPDGTHQATIGPDVPSPGLVSVDPNTGHSVVAGNLGWFAGPRLYVFDGVDRVADTPFAEAVNGGAVTGIAVDGPTTGHLYAATDIIDCCGVVGGQVFELAELPTVTIDPATDVTASKASLHGAVNPKGRQTSYYFEYSTDGSTWLPVTPFNPGQQQETPKLEDAGSGTSAVPVEDQLTGLAPNSEYQVRLVAINDVGTQVVDTAFTTLAPAPTASTLAAGNVSQTAATLAGKVGPNNSQTTYRFEYGPTTSYGSTVPATPADAGSGGAVELFTEQITGLTTATTYHFRIVAENPSGVAEGQDRTFKTADDVPTVFAPRGYEKVSPDDKDGRDVVTRDMQSSSPSGDRVTFNLNGVAPDSPSGQSLTTFLGEREGGKWSLDMIDPPARAGFGLLSYFDSHSDDLSKSVVQAHAALTPGATERAQNYYLRDNSTGTYQLITPVTSNIGFAGNQLFFDGASADYSHVVFESREGLAQTSEPIAGPVNPYEWIDGEVRLVGILPDGSPASQGAKVGSGTFSMSSANAISADGGRIFFHAMETMSLFSGAGQLYVRENGATTTHVTASLRTDCADDANCGGDGKPDPLADPAGPLPAIYWTAERSHGDKVLFTSCEKLTDDSTADASAGLCSRGDPEVPQAPSGSDLYRFDVETGELIDLTVDDPEGGDVLGVVGTSDDLERVYFVARGVLAQGGVSGNPNLYIWDHGTIRFIATLRGDTSQFFNDSSIGDEWNWSARRIDRNFVSRVSADGDRLVITAREPISGYDNANPECRGGRCSQVYAYDLALDRLSCVSCRPDGQPPTGDTQLAKRGTPVPTFADPLPRNLSADGETLFFETPEDLTPEDTNGALDVYEWRDGDVRLVSGGRGGASSRFLDASADGHDVFFTTRDRLVGADVDDFIDLYDARVGGGTAEPAAAQPPCAGDGCQGPLKAPQAGRSPASETFAGRGDLEPGNARASFRLAAIGSAQRRAFARTGSLRLRVTVPRAGRITAATNRGRRISARAGSGGTKTLVVRLSSRARKALQRRGRLEVRITVRFGGSVRTTSVVLRRAK